jgi:two-component SAPR family response regulator
MNTKLTLSIDERIIREAKKYAIKKNSSLSSLVENYLKTLTNIKKADLTYDSDSTIVKSLKSSFKLPKELDYKKELKNRLSDKYL